MISLILLPLGLSVVSLFFRQMGRGFLFLLGALPLLLLLTGGTSWIGERVDYPWIPALGISFALKCDSLALFFLYLAFIIQPIALLAQEKYTSTFTSLSFLLQALVAGFFLSNDLVLFTIFWEAMLLPIFCILFAFGGPERRKTAMQFLIYMIAGSTLLVAAVLGLYLFSAEHTFKLDILTAPAHALPLFLIFMLAFAVKTPLFPFHGWLPQTYYEATTGGTILLSSLLSKAGIFGVLRVGVGIFPEEMQLYGFPIALIAIFGVFYAGFAAYRQTDFKKTIAYCSLSHVNFIWVGLFVWEGIARTGAVMQALNHALTIAALFLTCEWVFARTGSTAFSSAQGLVQYYPRIAWSALVFVLSAVALPGTNNFIGELLIFIGLFRQDPWLFALLLGSVILSALYMLRWMKLLFFGPAKSELAGKGDLQGSYRVLPIALAAALIIIGIYPQPVLKLAERAQKEIVK